MERLRLAIGLIRAWVFCWRNPAYKVRRFRCVRTGKIKAVDAEHAEKAKPSEIFYKASGGFVATGPL